MRNAVIVGGGIAGLFTSKVLSKHYDHVTLIERDEYPADPGFRQGVPQSRQGHLLLGAGQQALTRFFPQLDQRIQDSGIASFEWGTRATPVKFPAGWAAETTTGIRSYALSRPWLEWGLRSEISEIDNITILSNMLHEDFVLNGDTVTGVVVKDRATNETRTINAELVVDVRGKRSDLPDWLENNGFERPHEEVVNSFLGYATCWFKEPEGFNEDWQAMAVLARPNDNFGRSALILRAEDNQWVVVVCGAAKDYPPTDEEGFWDFLKSLDAPELYHWARKGEAITPIFGYRDTYSRLYHFERVTKHPKGLIAMGDAVCCFNPVYGQGMSVIGQATMMLDDHLSQYGTVREAEFYKALNKSVQNAWLMSTGGDLVYPTTEGQRPNAINRLIQRYVDYLGNLMPYDTEVARSYIRVINMVDEPFVLLQPRFIWKTIRHALRRQQPRSTVNIAMPVEA